MAYTVKFQTESKYKSISYGSNSIYNSACGPASLCNALKALGLADISIPTMRNLAVSCGALGGYVGGVYSKGVAD